MTHNNSLTNSFNDLNTRDDDDNLSEFKVSPYHLPNTGPGLSMQLTIPQIEMHGRRMYYGFEVAEEWLIQYGITENRKRGYTAPLTSTNIFLLGAGLLLLMENTGIRPIRPKSVFP